MTLGKKIKKLVEEGYRITFKPVYESYAVTVGRGVDEKSYMFLPREFTEKEIVVGIDRIIERLNRQK